MKQPILKFNSKEFSVFYHKTDSRHYAIRNGAFPLKEFQKPPDQVVEAFVFDKEGNMLGFPIYQVNKQDLEWTFSTSIKS